MKLVDDIKGIWRHYSTIALATAGSLQGVWAGLPDPVRDSLPKGVGVAIAWITFAIAIAGIGGKCIDQSPKGPAP